MSDAVEPYAFHAPLTICVDIKNPHAYLALEPTFGLADALAIDVDWLPLVAPALKSHEPPAPDADRGTRHRWHRASYQAADLERYANSRGLKLGNPYRAPDSELAAMALLWVKARAPGSLRPFLSFAFERYWRETLDIESVSALIDLISEIGAPGDGFEEYARGPGPGQRLSLDAALRAAGAFSVPTYWVGGEPFLGRQHLPMIRRLLTQS